MSVVIDIASQELLLQDATGELAKYSVSTARNGPGQRSGSECTPLGKHIVRAKIGDGVPINTVFVGRRPSGEVYSPVLAEQNISRDWILTRILWLSGSEAGRNRLGDCDTMRRFIYIHGCPDSDLLGAPGSHGCIKMRNLDVVELFDRVRVGESVDIVPFI